MLRTGRSSVTRPVQAMGTDCAAHRHRELVPLEVHHIWPTGYGGPDTNANRVKLCSNAHSSVHDLLGKMLKGPVPWTVRRRYGWRVRRLAQRGYDAIQAARFAPVSVREPVAPAEGGTPPADFDG